MNIADMMMLILVLGALAVLIIGGAVVGQMILNGQCEREDRLS